MFFWSIFRAQGDKPDPAHFGHFEFHEAVPQLGSQGCGAVVSQFEACLEAVLKSHVPTLGLK